MHNVGEVHAKQLLIIDVQLVAFKTHEGPLYPREQFEHVSALKHYRQLLILHEMQLDPANPVLHFLHSEFDSQLSQFGMHD